MSYLLTVEFKKAPDGVADVDREYDDYQDAADAVNRWADLFEHSLEIRYSLYLTVDRIRRIKTIATNDWSETPTRAPYPE